jgi:ArsR family transcriptional regulator, arsenate/arsenite/antimonite-responsive transcriptional repressor / arsenate reductase (thioredoxin)
VDSIAERAALHAALGEPVRLAIVDDLTVSDRSPKDLAICSLITSTCSKPSD